MAANEKPLEVESEQVVVTSPISNMKLNTGVPSSTKCEKISIPLRYVKASYGRPGQLIQRKNSLEVRTTIPNTIPKNTNVAVNTSKNVNHTNGNLNQRIITTSTGKFRAYQLPASILKQGIKTDQHKILNLVPMKGKSDGLKRIVLPRMSSTAVSNPINIVLPSIGRQLAHNYVFSPTGTRPVLKPQASTQTQSKTPVASPQIQMQAKTAVSSPASLMKPKTSTTSPAIQLQARTSVTSTGTQMQPKSAVKTPDVQNQKPSAPNIIRQKGGVTSSGIKPLLLNGPFKLQSKTGQPILISTSSNLMPINSASQSQSSKPLNATEIDLNETCKENANESVKENAPESASESEMVVETEIIPNSIEKDIELEANDIFECPLPPKSLKPDENKNLVNKSDESDEKNSDPLAPDVIINGYKNSEEIKVTMVPTERTRKRKANHIYLTENPPPSKKAVKELLPEMIEFPLLENVDITSICNLDEKGMCNFPGLNMNVSLTKNGMIVLDENENDEQSLESSDGILNCVKCSCYGLASEFYDTIFCSSSCLEMVKSQIENLIEQMALDGNYLRELPRGAASDIKDKNGDGNLIHSGPRNATHSLDDDNINNNLPLFATVVAPQNGQAKPNKALKQRSNHSKPGPDQLQPYYIQPETSIDESYPQDLHPGKLVIPKQTAESGFPWGHYLSKSGCEPAWIRLFGNPVPEEKNFFVLGQMLEAIDPEHQSLFCPVSVAEVKGLRVRLHFLGYSNKYDFWVNSDSANVFPCGFCSRHGIKLQAPGGFDRNSFSWRKYRSRYPNIIPVVFPNRYRLNQDMVNLFKVGMKLEAVDKKNAYLVCVASIAGVIENRVLIHFDGWDDNYDYWTDISSPYLHPAGWCQKYRRTLTPPQGIKPSEFSWGKYLKRTKSICAPSKAFILRPHNQFRVGTKLEAVDKRAPHLLRPATVAKVLPYQIFLAFDGYPSHFGYWVDDDCPDIHPVGWGQRTNHDVQCYPRAAELNATDCPTPGCVGEGNFNNPQLPNHRKLDECPYSQRNLNASYRFLDRLTSLKRLRTLAKDVYKDEDDAEEFEIKKKWEWIEQMNKEKSKKMQHRKHLKQPKLERRNSDKSTASLGYLNDTIDSDVEEIKAEDDHIVHDLTLDSDSNDIKEEIIKKESNNEIIDVLDWDTNELVNYLQEHNFSNATIEKIKAKNISGESLLMMSCEDLTHLSKLGLTEEDGDQLFLSILELQQSVHFLQES